MLDIIHFNFFMECFILQLTIIILIYLFISVQNIYYSLLYLFLLILFSGVVLCFCNNELTAGFLWVTEYIVIFVLLLLLFYINNTGKRAKEFTKIYLFIFSILAISLENSFLVKDSELMLLSSDLIWFDYYESLHNDHLNDFFGFFLSYYFINNLILILIGLVLFFGSIICVLLFRLIKVVKFNNVSSYFNLISFSQTFLYCIFMRKQDLFDQNYKTYGSKMVFSTND